MTNTYLYCISVPSQTFGSVIFSRDKRVKDIKRLACGCCWAPNKAIQYEKVCKDGFERATGLHLESFEIYVFKVEEITSFPANKVEE